MKRYFPILTTLLVCVLIICCSCKGKKSDNNDQTNSKGQMETSDLSTYIHEMRQNKKNETWGSDTYKPKYNAPCNAEEKGYKLNDISESYRDYLNLNNYPGNDNFIHKVLYQNDDPDYLDRALDFSIDFALPYNAGYEGQIIPDYQIVSHYWNSIESKSLYCFEEICLDKRRFVDYDYQESNENFIPYAKIVDYLSRNRLNTNFYDLYNQHKEVVFHALSAKKYLENYRSIVNSLLYAYNDLRTDKELFDLLYNSYYNVATTLVDSDKESIARYDIIEKHFEKKQDFREEDDMGMKLFYHIDKLQAYSFWIRRYNENNADNVYLTLLDFKEDYDNKLKHVDPENYSEVADNDLFEWIKDEADNENSDLNKHNWDNQAAFNATLNKIDSTQSYVLDIEKAIGYAIQEIYNNAPSFYLGYAAPNYVETREFRNKLSGDTYYYTYNIPISERKLSMDLDLSNKGVLAYAKIVNYLSKNRERVNFLNLYLNNKPLIHEYLTKEVYDREYRNTVDDLITTYRFLVFGNSDFYTLRKKLYSDYTSYDEHLEDEETAYNFVSQIHATRKDKLTKEYNIDEIFFLYSFWARRYKEQNIDNVFKTLRQIQDDYKAMENK